MLLFLFLFVLISAIVIVILSSMTSGIYPTFAIYIRSLKVTLFFGPVLYGTRAYDTTIHYETLNYYCGRLTCVAGHGCLVHKNYCTKATRDYTHTILTRSP